MYAAAPGFCVTSGCYVLHRGTTSRKGCACDCELEPLPLYSLFLIYKTNNQLLTLKLGLDSLLELPWNDFTCFHSIVGLFERLACFLVSHRYFEIDVFSNLAKAPMDLPHSLSLTSVVDQASFAVFFEQSCPDRRGTGQQRSLWAVSLTVTGFV